MSEPLLQNESTHGYHAVVDRADELERLGVQAQKRKSMLVFGPGRGWQDPLATQLRENATTRGLCESDTFTT
jgi:hypothetical protein